MNARPGSRLIHCLVGALLLTSPGLLLSAPVNAKAESLPSAGDSFTLTAHDGSRFESDRLKGKIVLLYFGFTSCPDVCPLELSNIGRALHALPDDQVTGLFVTIDPSRDTVERLASYVTFFHPDLIGLTGTEEEIREVANQYNISYRRIEQGTSYTMEHPANVYVLDPEGTIRAMAPFGSTSEHLVRLVRGIAADSAAMSGQD
ncbi:MAG: SCO family protein [Gammaproteobacteria bacterium]|nr:SCO family protein [Gammaproteobacteria bacterium]MXX16135.1 SCO family protein [Gammaproteobacteria bacterium]MXY66412.1 SCO family protein [Gammaproteobacteria bacterium]MYG68056.1 SCO family protein [Gammaproteobacteria bacterium]MYH89425.1 SCO family protein [Gammaproteobacteria bacterium]